MNTIGVSCPDFGAVPFSDMLKDIAGKFSHWEIFSEADHAVQKISGGFADYTEPLGMTFSIHTSIADTDLAAVNDRMREAAVMEMMSEMEAAVQMGIDTLTVHPGIVSLSVKGIRDRSIMQAKNSMRMLDRASQEYGVTACIENMPNFPIMLGITADELNTIVDGTDLGICFDIGHANTSGQMDAMIDTFGDRISNVHIHDNMGKNDDHMTIGDGNIDFRHVIGRLRKYAGRYIIESKTLESAIESQERLKKILPP